MNFVRAIAMFPIIAAKIATLDSDAIRFFHLGDTLPDVNNGIKVLSSCERAWGSKPLRIIGAEGGSRTRTTLRSTDFKSVGDGTTWSYQTIRISISRPSGRQGIASYGFVSTR